MALGLGHSSSFDLSIEVQKPFQEWLEFEAADAANTKVVALLIESNMYDCAALAQRTAATNNRRQSNVSPTTHEKR